MITYDWNCKTVDVVLQEKGLTDVVYNVHWIVTGTSDTYSSTSIGTQTVVLDESTPFVPFADLTNDIVVGWTKDAMGEEQVTAIESNIASVIETEINPVTATMQLPG
jgi:hypothetical protein